jgi:hypothetical protein
MLKSCSGCGSSDFRLSHFRGEDVFQLVCFQYPVRCRTCRQRDYAFFWQALKIRRGTELRHQQALHDKQSRPPKKP